METVFDCRRGGMGDAIVALWIAEGARQQGHTVRFCKGHTDSLVTSAGFDLTDLDQGVQFGGDSPSYNNEMQMRVNGARPTRTLLWQSHTPFKVPPCRPTFEIPESSKQWAQEKRQEVARNKPLALIFPFANYQTRCWPTHKFARLGHLLEKEGYGTITSHTRREGLETSPWYLWGHHILDMAALMLEADIVIANDSGTAHLAGTLGTQTVAIMGPTNPHTVFGYCPDITCLRVSKEVVPCVGCHFEGEKGYRAFCDNGCEALASLSVTEVFNQVLDLRKTPLAA